jgi:predicted metalloprotease with PDZ domain
MMAGTASHEFFHLWNVKRIRPAEMWPYDYSRDDETPLLWVSEGFTNYYGGLALYRAGLRSKESFLLGVGRAISDIEGNDARNYISPANSSTSTWLGYDTPVAFGISYYTQGQNLGGLLDLSILHDTGGKTRLDEVMRELYTGFYKKNRGFSTQDLIGVINRITGSDYREFFRRYVAGVEVPDYDRILGYAGYRLDKSTRKTVSIGWDLRFGPDGARVHRVQPDSPAAKAGIAAGDIILTIDGQEPRRSVLTEKTDQTVKVGLKRQGEQKTVDMLVESQETIGYRVVEVEHPSADQLKVREAWLRQDK